MLEVIDSLHHRETFRAYDLCFWVLRRISVPREHRTAEKSYIDVAVWAFCQGDPKIIEDSSSILGTVNSINFRSRFLLHLVIQLKEFASIPSLNRLPLHQSCHGVDVE